MDHPSEFTAVRVRSAKPDATLGLQLSSPIHSTVIDRWSFCWRFYRCLSGLFLCARHTSGGLHGARVPNGKELAFFRAQEPAARAAPFLGCLTFSLFPQLNGKTGCS